MKMAVHGAFKFGVISLILPSLFLMRTQALRYQRTQVSACVPIQEELCRDHYQYTTMPNILGHESQVQASRRLAEYKELIINKCSPRIKFFLCSLHFPMCVKEIPYGIPACREMCEEVRSDCEPFYKAFGFEWPETIRCDKLKYAHTNSCLIPPPAEARPAPRFDPREVMQTDPDYYDVVEYDVTEEDGSDVIDSDVTPSDKEKRKQKNKRRRDRNRKRKEESKDGDVATEDDDDESPPPPPADKRVPVMVDSVKVEIEEEKPTMATEVHKDEGSKEPEEEYPRWNPISVNKGPIYTGQQPAMDAGQDYMPGYDTEYNQFVPNDSEKEAKCNNPKKFLYVERIEKCLPVCDIDTDVMFSSNDKRFAYYWMLCCSILCAVSSAFTVGTFLVDSKRFRYPERPIIFLSLCYLLYSCAYLVRLGRGPDGSVSCVTKDGTDVKHIVMGDLESTGCTAVFFLLYYFGMAAAVWWVILSVTWFLAAGLKWGHEAIEAHGFYFHLVAWLLPAAQTIIILVMGKVDGDELTGLCYVGNLDKESLLYFVIIPLTSYLGIGALALSSGFLSLLKIRRVILRKSGEKDAGKLEKLMLKIGIFTVLYIVPTACVVAVNVYQYNNQDIWQTKAEETQCHLQGFPSEPNIAYHRGYRNVPEYPPYYAPREYPQDYAYQGYAMPRYPPRYQNYGDGYPVSVVYPPYYPDSGYYKGGYQPETGYNQNSGTDTGYDEARPFYTGREIVAVPPHLNPRYHPPGRPNRRKQMQYDPNTARNLEQIYGDHGVPSVVNPGGSQDATKQALDCHLEESIPSFPIFAIKIFMSLLAGITSGIWVWSGKTYKSWKLFCRASWCGKRGKEKESVTSNTPQATSSANVHGPPSVTSQLLPKSSGRPSPDGEVPAHNGDRYSFPIISSDRYQGYNQVKQDDDIRHDDVTYTTSSPYQPGHTTGLTLGDIAREYSDNLDSEYRERMVSPRSGRVMTSKSFGDDVILDANEKLHYSKKYQNYKKQQAKSPRDGGSRDLPTVYNARSTRAIPNVYEDSPSQRGGRYNKQTNRDMDGTYPKPHKHRVRKYSENDANKLSLVSESGFSPMSGTTRTKAHSVHVGASMACT